MTPENKIILGWAAGAWITTFLIGLVGWCKQEPTPHDGEAYELTLWDAVRVFFWPVTWVGVALKSVVSMGIWLFTSSKCETCSGPPCTCFPGASMKRCLGCDCLVDEWHLCPNAKQERCGATVCDNCNGCRTGEFVCSSQTANGHTPIPSGGRSMVQPNQPWSKAKSEDVCVGWHWPPAGKPMADITITQKKDGPVVVLVSSQSCPDWNGTYVRVGSVLWNDYWFLGKPPAYQCSECLSIEGSSHRPSCSKVLEAERHVAALKELASMNEQQFQHWLYCKVCRVSACKEMPK